MTTPKLTKNQYDDLKIKYLNKNRSLHSLYNELNNETAISKHSFFELINKIRQEEGLGIYYKIGKQKKKNNIITHLDKSPKCYN